MIYFELLQSWIRLRTGLYNPAGIYCVNTHDELVGLHIVLAQAERAWKETDDGVKYLKDRLSWDRPVDLDEFAWIKLRAKPLSD